MTLALDLEPRLPLVPVDPDKMEQVFLNLVDNATQAMPDGGKLSVGTHLHNGHVEFTFADTGTGIPPENLERIFEPLFTTKAKGIGLGLSIVKLLVEAHQGRIDVASVPDQGTQFTVFVPHSSAVEEENAA